MMLWSTQPSSTPAHAKWESVEIPRGADLGVFVRNGVVAFSTGDDRAPHPERDLVARLVPFDRHGVGRVALVSSAPSDPRDAPALLVNGFPPLSVVTLEDRDEIVVGSAVLLFAAHAAQAVRPYARIDAPLSCARCHLRLATGDEVLRCAGCGAPSHEGDLAAEPPGRPSRLMCASYDARCGACARRRDELVWHPEGGEGAGEGAGDGGGTR